MTKSKSSSIPEDLYNIELTTIGGKATTLDAYRGKTLLIVNVASRCGFTKQYKDLQQLYDDYQQKGLVVLGFPCNQFLRQEPEKNERIDAFAKSCFRVTFPLFEKIDVIGDKKSPLYAYLGKHIEKKPWIFIPWNFTKILVNSQGHVLKRYAPWTSFKKIRHDLEQLLIQSRST